MAARRALLGELLMTLSTVASVLKEKEKSKLVSVVPSTSVADAVRAMNDENIGAVLVLDGQKLVGIFTERDVMVRVALSPDDTDHHVALRKDTHELLTIQNEHRPYVLVIHCPDRVCYGRGWHDADQLRFFFFF